MTDDALIATIALDEWLNCKARIAELEAQIAESCEDARSDPEMGGCPLSRKVTELEAARARAYMRLQCADVPRDPWHWEVCEILNETCSPSRPDNVSLSTASSDETLDRGGEPK